MAPDTLDDLDAMIRREKERVAVEVFRDAWDEVIAEGIEPALVAETAVHTLFRRLCDTAGLTVTEALVDDVAERLQCGGYLPEHSIQ